jgi:glyoxylase-like metal-dependent hydrolase (beta-lactamase superfamily II)
MALEHPWSEPPAAAQTIEVAPGVRWLRMPLPFQLDHINLWLLADGDGWTAVDTGVALAPTRERWEQLFAHGLEGKPIRRVLVTHFHPDHIGNASWLTERWSADLWCTQTEWLAAEYALRSRDDADLDRRVAHYRRHGIAEEHTAKMPRARQPLSRPGGRPAVPFHADRGWRDGGRRRPAVARDHRARPLAGARVSVVRGPARAHRR